LPRTAAVVKMQPAPHLTPYHALIPPLLQHGDGPAAIPSSYRPEPFCVGNYTHGTAATQDANRCLDFSRHYILIITWSTAVCSRGIKVYLHLYPIL